MDASSMTKTEKRRSSRGRQRIEIKKLEDEARRQVTFSKRRRGLFNKAKELSTLCGTEVVILTLSKSGKLFTTENAEAVLGRFLSDTDPNPSPNQEEFGVGSEENGFWWDQPPENLALPDLLEYAMALQELRQHAAARLAELEPKTSTPLLTDHYVSKEDFVAAQTYGFPLGFEFDSI